MGKVVLTIIKSNNKVNLLLQNQGELVYLKEIDGINQIPSIRISRGMEINGHLIINKFLDTGKVYEAILDINEMREFPEKVILSVVFDTKTQIIEWNTNEKTFVQEFEVPQTKQKREPEKKKEERVKMIDIPLEQKIRQGVSIYFEKEERGIYVMYANNDLEVPINVKRIIFDAPVYISYKGRDYEGELPLDIIVEPGHQKAIVFSVRTEKDVSIMTNPWAEISIVTQISIGTYGFT